jgi:hypothetical protein
MDIQAFKTVIDKNSLLDATRYTVNISGPVGPLRSDFTTLCNAATLPGRGFGTADKYNHGPIRKVPYAELYDEVSTTFYMTTSMELHEYFNQWQELIGGEQYYIAYYHDIIGSVIINVEDKQDRRMATYELFEAYPSSISPLDFGYALGGRVTEFTVNWAYHHFERKIINLPAFLNFDINNSKKESRTPQTVPFGDRTSRPGGRGGI